MKVVFFSESGIVGKTPRNHPNARNDIAWSIMMGADWCPYEKQPTDHYDLGVVTIPKTKPNLDIDLFRQHWDKIVVMQEGEIVERGTHQVLIGQGGVYKKLTDLQSFS